MGIDIGHIYDVKGEDCCVRVWFTSRLVGIKYDESDAKKEYPTYTFENGVEIDGWGVVLATANLEKKGGGE